MLDSPTMSNGLWYGGRERFDSLKTIFPKAKSVLRCDVTLLVQYEFRKMDHEHIQH